MDCRTGEGSRKEKEEEDDEDEENEAGLLFGYVAFGWLRKRVESKATGRMRHGGQEIRAGLSRGEM